MDGQQEDIVRQWYVTFEYKVYEGNCHLMALFVTAGGEQVSIYPET